MPVIHCILYHCLCIDMFPCWDGLNMIFVCFFEPIWLPLGVCASRLRLIPAGVRMWSSELACRFMHSFMNSLNKDFHALPWLSKHTQKLILGSCTWSLNSKETKYSVFCVLTRKTRFIVAQIVYRCRARLWFEHGACGDGSEAIILVRWCFSLILTARDSP